MMHYTVTMAAVRMSLWDLRGCDGPELQLLWNLPLHSHQNPASQLPMAGSRRNTNRGCFWTQEILSSNLATFASTFFPPCLTVISTCLPLSFIWGQTCIVVWWLSQLSLTLTLSCQIHFWYIESCIGIFHSVSWYRHIQFSAFIHTYRSSQRIWVSFFSLSHLTLGMAYERIQIWTQEVESC